MILYIRYADAVKAVQILGCFLEFSHSRPIAGIRQAKILPNVVDPHLEKTVAHFYLVQMKIHRDRIIGQLGDFSTACFQQVQKPLHGSFVRKIRLRQFPQRA